MKRAIPTLLAGLALASCNQGPSVSVTNATPEQVVKATKAAGVEAPLLHAGQWETKSEITELTLPGMDKLPPQMAEQMKSRMSKTTTVSACITPDQAKKPDPAVLAGRADSHCKFDHYTMADGKIDALMTCQQPNGSMSMQVNGSFSPESIDERAEMTATGPNGAMHSKTHVTSHRIGDCTAAAADGAAK